MQCRSRPLPRRRADMETRWLSYAEIAAAERLPPDTPDDIPRDVPHDDGRDVGGDAARTFAAVEAHIRAMEAAAAPVLRTTIDALKAALETERARVAELRTRVEADARRPW